MKKNTLESKIIIDGPPILMPFVDGKYWMSLNSITWKAEDSDREVTIPPNFVTDFASVPFLFRGMVPRWGKHGRAAIIHDYLYWEQNLKIKEADNVLTEILKECKKRKEADIILEEVMTEYNVSFINRKIIYFAVRRFGCWAWYSNKRAKRSGKVRVFSKDQLPNETETFKEFEERLREPKNTKKHLEVNDNIFRSHNLKTPILFAHRGGDLEVPESTNRAFSHALNDAKADVLEIDVQLTKDAKIVVWHGPKLDRVYIEGQSIHPKKRRRKRYIYEHDWSELDGKAWVADPDTSSLEDVLKDKEGRELLLLSKFLNSFPEVPLNIELKESFKKNLGGHNGLSDNIAKFIEILDAGKHKRDIIVASVSHSIIEEFRNQSNERYVTNLSWWEYLKLYFTKPNLRNRVLETVYHKFISSEILINRVRRLGGSTYVFLTKFGPFPSIDINPKKHELKIMQILDRGVDGIMTGSPKKVLTIIETWKNRRCSDL